MTCLIARIKKEDVKKLRLGRFGTSAETLLWHKAGVLDTKKPHHVMRLSLKWLPLRNSTRAASTVRHFG